MEAEPGIEPRSTALQAITDYPIIKQLGDFYFRQRQGNSPPKLLIILIIIFNGESDFYMARQGLFR